MRECQQDRGEVLSRWLSSDIPSVGTGVSGYALLCVARCTAVEPIVCHCLLSELLSRRALVLGSVSDRKEVRVTPVVGMSVRQTAIEGSKDPRAVQSFGSEPYFLGCLPNAYSSRDVDDPVDEAADSKISQP